MEDLTGKLSTITLAPRPNEKVEKQSLTALPFNPDLIKGSLDDYPTNKIVSWWGTYLWPFDCFDPWDPKNPRNRVNYRSPSTKSAEDFINPYELRHHFYDFILSSGAKHLGDFKGFLTSCKMINKEVTNILLPPRVEHIAAQRAHWSKEYRAAVLIADATCLGDLPAAQVQLPASMFTQEWAYDNPSPAAATPTNPHGNRFQPDIPMGTLPLAHLEITTYDPHDEQDYLHCVSKYAREINNSLSVDTAFDKISFDWRAIIPSRGKLLNPDPNDTSTACLVDSETKRIVGFDPGAYTYDWRKLKTAGGWKREWLYDTEWKRDCDVVGAVWTRLKEGEEVPERKKKNIIKE